MKEWFNADPDRWKKEINALKEANISFTEDEKLKAHGLMRLTLTITDKSHITNLPHDVLPLTLIVTFPSSYPYFRPTVFAPELTLARHQNHFDKNLCLIPRASRYWLPQTTLAEHLDEQLAKVIIEGRQTDAEVIAGNPDEQAEPISEYYPAWTNASIIFDPKAFELIADEGKNIQFLGTMSLGAFKGEKFPFRMAGLESMDSQNNPLGESMAESVKEQFPAFTAASIYRLKDPPPYNDPKEVYRWLAAKLTEQGESIKKHKEIKKGNVTLTNIVGLTFLEEQEPGKTSWGWIFIINYSGQQMAANSNKPVPFHSAYFAKSNRLNTAELSFRMPSLKPLADKTIVIVGLGALGAPSTIEFARNCVGKIKAVDGDIINAGTIIRYPLGIRSAGLPKVEAIQKFVYENYPFTQVVPYPFSIGNIEATKTDIPQEKLMAERIEEIFEGASLIYDASAETGVNHFLSQEAKIRNIPYICVEATPGVWGGNVMRFVPNNTDGCWMCAQFAFEDGTLPNPPQDRAGNIQAPGCGDISFIGASFELNNLVAAGVRLAISTLCQGEEGYQDIESDIGVLSLVDDHGHPIFPSWKTFKMQKHPKCPYCNK